MSGTFVRAQCSATREPYKLLDMVEQVVEVDKGELSLDVSVFGQVATRVTLLGPERFLNAEDVSKTRQARLEVQLRTLSEVRLLAVVVERKEGRATLDLSLDHAGRGDFEEAEVGVRLAERGQERGADFEDGRGVLATDDEVTRVGEQGRVRFLQTRIVGDEQARSSRPRTPSPSRKTHLVDLVEECLLTAGSLADDGEPVGGQLVVVRGGLAFRELVDDTSDLDGRLEGQSEGVVGLRL